MITEQKNQWKRYYTRAYWMQDCEMPTIFPTMEQSKGNVTEALFIPNEGKMEAWWRQDQWEVYLRDIAQDFLQPNFSLTDHKARFVAARATLERTIESIAAQAPTANPKQLVEMVEKLRKCYRIFLPFIWYPWGITFFLEQWCTERLQQRYSNWEEMIEVIGRTPQRIQMEKMIDAVCEWHTGTRDKEALDGITKQYGYLSGYSARDHAWTNNEIIERAQPLDQCVQRLNSIPRTAAEITASYTALYQQLLTDDAQLAHAVDVIHEYIWLRTERIDVFKWSRMNIQPFYRRVEELFHWPFGLSVYLTHGELLAALNGITQVTKEELQRRETEGYVSYVTPQQTTVIVDKEEREKFIEEKLGTRSYTQEQCKGQTACKGVVTGRVRVILHTQDIHQFQQGEILVSNMTHPDYMPAIRKALGIITDEGGIVCHAAVISRELGIPCIIGTGDATKIFKTGDMVCVDATAGSAAFQA